MARKKQPIAARNLTNPAAQAATFAQRERPDALMWIGLLALLLAAGMMAMLALERLFGMALPGCGAGSPCAQAQGSVWGKVPGIGWPISYLGLAYFTAIMPAWWLSGRRVVTWLRYVILLGGAVSILYLVVIFTKNMLCQYCLTAHVANLLFCGLTLARGGAAVPMSAAALPAALGVFVGMTAVLGITDSITRRAIDQANLRKADESGDEMIRKSLSGSTTTQSAKLEPSVAPTTQPEPPSSSDPSAGDQPQATGQAASVTTRAVEQPIAAATTGGSHSGDAAPIAGGADSQPAAQPVLPANEKPFTGRYRRGPDPAPIRIVMFFDFQCRDCQRIEAEIESLLATRDDISLSTKHFPMNTPCNPAAPNLHENACWAARAVEAAGIIGGNDAFWKMHAWLFKEKGSFTNEKLRTALPELGFDVDQFVTVMQSEETLRRVKEDIQEGIDLGLYFTPMIFINGVELKGWNAPNAVKRVVDRLTEAKVPPQSVSADRPPTASQKYVDDWREWPRQPIAPPSRNWGRGPSDAAVRIVVFGDYQEPNTRDLQNELTRLIAGRTDVSYVFRHFPFNKDCNPAVGTTRFAAACAAARAAEAAGVVGGVDGYQHMHAWLFANQEKLSEEFIRANVAALGLDADAFLAAWSSPEVAARVAEDVAAARRINVNSLPSLYVNERLVPRWRRENDNVLERIIQEAAAGK